MELLGGYQRELSFYQHVAGAAADANATCLRRAHDRGFGPLRLGARGPVRLGQRRPSRWAVAPIAGARTCIEQLAGLHAWSKDGRNAAVLETFPSIDTPIVRDLLIPAFGPGWKSTSIKSSEPVSSAVARFAGRFARAAGSSTASADRTLNASAR